MKCATKFEGVNPRGEIWGLCCCARLRRHGGNACLHGEIWDFTTFLPKALNYGSPVYTLSEALEHSLFASAMMCLGGTDRRQSSRHILMVSYDVA